MGNEPQQITPGFRPVAKRGLRIPLLAREGRDCCALRLFSVGLVAQPQVFEVHIVRQPARAAHYAVQHLFVVPERTVRRLQVHQDCAVTFLTITTVKIDAHGEDDDTASAGCR
jgi:hypothetical protein